MKHSNKALSDRFVDAEIYILNNYQTF